MLLKLQTLKLLNIIILCSLFSFNSYADQVRIDPQGNWKIRANSSVPWQSVDAFWRSYAAENGGLTWGVRTDYPDYEKVNEYDTMIIRLKQGECLMEFYHSRWRRANDVRRWNEDLNEYGGCPHVFD